MLQKVYVPIINNRVCYVWHELKDIILELHDEMFCAGHEQGKMDACLVSITPFLSYLDIFYLINAKEKEIPNLELSFLSRNSML